MLVLPGRAKLFQVLHYSFNLSQAVQQDLEKTGMWVRLTHETLTPLTVWPSKLFLLQPLRLSAGRLPRLNAAQPSPSATISEECHCGRNVAKPWGSEEKDGAFFFRPLFSIKSQKSWILFCVKPEKKKKAGESKQSWIVSMTVLIWSVMVCGDGNYERFAESPEQNVDP